MPQLNVRSSSFWDKLAVFLSQSNTAGSFHPDDSTFIEADILSGRLKFI
jgi:hypothetical protein